MEDLFTNRAPTEGQGHVLDAVTDQMIDTAELLNTLPPSRYRSLALTKLEECSMWAKKAVVFTVGVGSEDVAAAATPATDQPTESGG